MHTHIGRAVPSGGNARAKLPPTIVTNANLRVSSLHESWLGTLSLYDVAVGTRRSSTHTQKAVTTLNEIGNCTVCNIRCSRVPNSFCPCSRVCQSQRLVFQQTSAGTQYRWTTLTETIEGVITRDSITAGAEVSQLLQLLMENLSQNLGSFLPPNYRCKVKGTKSQRWKMMTDATLSQWHKPLVLTVAWDMHGMYCTHAMQKRSPLKRTHHSFLLIPWEHSLTGKLSLHKTLQFGLGLRLA